jgi:threonine synthase
MLGEPRVKQVQEWMPMLYYSTNHKSPNVSLKEAVLRGQAEDGGLFLPVSIPVLRASFFEAIRSLSLQEIALEVSAPLLGDDVPADALRGVIERALNFDAPLVTLEEGLHVLELFHGPTLAFKDFGARFMAQLMSYFIRNSDRKLTILVATSGDTGSAVAHGFLGAPGIDVIVLYPGGKVSEIQEKQMTTLGRNIRALEVDGTFDDCQKLVKETFTDKDLNETLQLTSANSINIARLIPQMFYYFRALAQLRDKSDHIIFSVPSGNFGNLTAGLMAKRMGLPVVKFIAATNANDVVPQYLATGVFAPRPSCQTLSSAMDVGNPSNFARILELYHHDHAAVSADILGSSHSDEETRHAVRESYRKYGYLFDPHGAVGYLALRKCSPVNGIILETAHPAKFQDIVEPAAGVKVEIPERLKSCLAGRKISVPMPNDFDTLKTLLLA